MSNDDVISKVRKLLALANNNTNVNEAAQAAARAQELLFQHKLSMAEVEATGGGADTEVIGAQNIDEETGLQLKWKGMLINVLAKAFYCEAISMVVRRTDGTKIARVQLIGKTSDTQTVAYMAEYLRREIERLAAEQCKGKGFAYANSFRVGAVTEIHTRLAMQKRTQESTMARDSAWDKTSRGALVVIKRDFAAVQEKFRAMYPKTRKGRGAWASRQDGFTDGRAAGATIGLGGGRGLGAAPKQIGGR